MDLPKGLPIGLNSNSLSDIIEDKIQQQSRLDGTDAVSGARSGVFGASGGASPIVATIAFAQHITRLSNSLGEVAPKGAGSASSKQFQDIEVLVASVLDKMQSTQEAVSKAKLVLDQSKQKGTLQDKAQKLEEAVHKQEEAEKKQNSLSIWDKIKLAFQWIGAMLTIAVGAIVTAAAAITGAGVAAGVLLITAGLVQLALAIDATVSAHTGKSIAGHVATAAGASEDVIRWLDVGFQVVGAIAGIALGIATAVVGGPAAAGSIAAMVASISGIVQGISGAALTTGSIAAGAVSYTASQNIAEAKELQAEANDLEAFIQLFNQIIDQLLSIITRASEQFNDALDGTVSSMNERASVLGRTQFAG